MAIRWEAVQEWQWASVAVEIKNPFLSAQLLVASYLPALGVPAVQCCVRYGHIFHLIAGESQDGWAGRDLKGHLLLTPTNNRQDINGEY